MRVPVVLPCVLFATWLCAACAPVMPTASPRPAPASSPPPDSGSAPPATAVMLPRERAEGLDCPIAFDEADVVLARVGSTVITACDVALADAADRREGLPPRARRAVLRSLVDEALLADAARVQGLDRDPGVQRRVRDVLGAALVHAEARRALSGELPDDTALRAHYDAHRDDFTSPERARLREIVVPTEAEARAILAETGTTPFESLVSRTHATDGARDQGDLGLVVRGGNDRVPAAIADAGFAVADPGGYAPEPIRVEQMVPVGRRHRLRREVAWHVVQFLGTVPSTTLTFDEARPVLWHRLAFGRVQSARLAARAALVERAQRDNPARVDLRAMGRVRLERAPRTAAATRPGARRR